MCEELKALYINSNILHEREREREINRQSKRYMKSYYM